MALTLQEQLSLNSDRLVNATNSAKSRDVQSDGEDGDAYTVLLAKYNALQQEYAKYKTDTDALLSLTNDKMNNCINLLEQIN